MKEVRLNGKRKRGVPRPVYNQCIWVVRDYERLCELVNRINETMPDVNGENIYYADDNEGLIKKAVVDNAKFQIKCVDEALLVVPEEMRRGIYENIAENAIFDDYTSVNTWKKWKERFLHQLAKKLNLY